MTAAETREFEQPPGRLDRLEAAPSLAPPGQLRRLASNPVAVGSAAVLALMAALALMAPVLAPAGPARTSLHTLAPPSWTEVMGTDDLGRNIVVGVMYGARTSLLVAAGVGLVAGLAAIVVGAAAGFVGGLTDDLLMRLTEFVMVLPRFFLAIATAALFGARLAPLIVLLGLISWPGPARILRSAVLTQRELPYVEAARAIGTRPWRILLRHVLPNALAPFIVSITLLSGGAILVEAGLSFLGLGDASAPSWGSMLRDAQPIMRYAPWTVLFPAAAVTAAVLSFNLLGDGLLEALSVRPATNLPLRRGGRPGAGSGQQLERK